MRIPLLRRLGLGTGVLALALLCCRSDGGTALAKEGAHEPTQKPMCELEVAGMSCASCPVQVRLALTRVPGVVEAEATLKPPVAHVELDPKHPPKEATLKRAVQEAGYQVASIQCHGLATAPQPPRKGE